MGVYRIEEASSSRAGCQNKECKDEKVKIQKGELRLGTFVENERFQSFMWRHWGCVTPKLISNMVQSLEDDGNATEDIDGFDEISSEFQDKVRGALEQGHVDDADWKGDVEMNRPGKNGFRVRVSKKDAKAAVAAADQSGEAEEKETAPKSKKRAAKADESKETPAAKKPKKGTRARKIVSEDEHNDAESESGEPQPKPGSKKSRPSKDEKPVEEKPARPRRKAAAKAA